MSDSKSWTIAVAEITSHYVSITDDGLKECIEARGTSDGFEFFKIQKEDSTSQTVDYFRVDIVPALGETPSLLLWALEGEEAWLTIKLDPDLFERVRTTRWRSMRVRFGLPYSALKFSGRAFISKIQDPSLFIEWAGRNATSPPSAAQTKVALEDIVLDQSSQLGLIAAELFQSAYCYFGPAKYRCISEISGIVSGLRESVERTGDDAKLLAHPITVFATSVRELDAERARKAKQDYENVWNHLHALDGFVNSKPPMREYALHEVADAYLGNPGFQSPRLEWLLIDSLLYAAVLSFSDEVTWLSIKTFKGFVLRVLWNSIKTWGGEAFALGLTYVVASYVDGNSGIGFWSIMATVTAIRWIRPDDQQIERKRLAHVFADLAGVQRRMANLDFNPRQIRNLLYELETRGVRINPYVLNLLDRRIERDRSRCAAIRAEMSLDRNT